MKLLNKDFEQIISNYNIGYYKSHKHLDWVLGSQVYELITTKDKYILKFMDNTNSLKKQLEIIDYLHKNKILVVKNIKSLKNKEIIKFQNKNIIIQGFVEGIHPKVYSNALIIDIAKNIAKMHKVLVKQNHKNKQIKFEREILPKDTEKRIVNKLNELNNQLNNINQTKIRKAIIHNDLSEVNILVKDNKLQAFIDWDDFGYNAVVNDIGVFIAHGFIRSKIIKIDKIKLFLKEYQKYINLNLEEKKAIYYLVKYRLFGIIQWYIKYSKERIDKLNELENGYHRNIARLERFEKISLKEFLTYY
jgi:Ser/Thr protein kinase RdoA (MazF antagonist)